MGKDKNKKKRSEKILDKDFEEPQKEEGFDWVTIILAIGILGILFLLVQSGKFPQIIQVGQPSEVEK